MAGILLSKDTIKWLAAVAGVLLIFISGAWFGSTRLYNCTETKSVPTIEVTKEVVEVEVTRVVTETIVETEIIVATPTNSPSTPTLSVTPTMESSVDESLSDDSNSISVTGDDNQIIQDVEGDVTINESPKFRTKTFVAGEATDTVIPLYESPPANILSLTNYIFLSYGVEIEILDEQANISLFDLEDLPSDLSSMMESLTQSLTVTEVKVLTGPYLNEIGWVPSHFIMQTEVPITEE